MALDLFWSCAVVDLSLAQVLVVAVHCADAPQSIGVLRRLVTDIRQ